MNLSGIWNRLPDLLGSQQTSSPASSTSTVPLNGASGASSQALIPNGGKTDQADLSSGGLAAAESTASDVRMDKVDSVRTAINAGTYQVSAQDVAAKMIQNLLD